MPKPFDATTKYLVQIGPAAWLVVASLMPDGVVTVLDTDLSTVSAAADALLRIDGPEPWLTHIEFQTTRDDLLPRRLLRYNVLSSDRHALPVVSVVILLRPEADNHSLNGVFQSRLPDGQTVLEFHYRVVRVWEVPVDTILQGELATLPLAPLADLSIEDVPRLVQELTDRIDRDASAEVAAEIWTATNILMGLRYTAEETQTLLRGVRAMTDSVTFQAILEQGREQGLEQGREQGLEQGKLQEAINVVMRLGSKRFGPADSARADRLETREQAGPRQTMHSFALISLGSNLGDRLANLSGAIANLGQVPGIKVRQVSSFHETEPVGGPPGQGMFLNAVVAIETDLDPLSVLRVIQEIEARFGRQRSVHWGERTLDLDMLLFDDRIIDTPELSVPHPRMHTRRFVLEPLVEVAPTAIDPVTGRPFAAILADLIGGES